METFSLFLFPMAACLLLILIHAYFGIHVLARGIVFVDLSLAQFIGIGVACSFLYGFDGTATHVLPACFAVLGAFILSISRRISKYTNIEAFIGVLYVFSLAVSILVLDRSPHGIEEFRKILNGNIIWVTGTDVFYALILYAIIGVFHFIHRERFFRLSFEGKGGYLWEFLFFMSFSIVLIKSIQLAGILLVFAFLIIPALIGRLMAKKTSVMLIAGWLMGVLSSVFGLWASYWWDLPPASLIVASLSLFYFMMLLIKVIGYGRQPV